MYANVTMTWPYRGLKFKESIIVYLSPASLQLFDIGQPCYGQLTPVSFFVRLTADQVLGSIRSQAQARSIYFRNE